MASFKLSTLPRHLIQKIALCRSGWTRPSISATVPLVGNPAKHLTKYMQLNQTWYNACIPLLCQELLIGMDVFKGTLDHKHYRQITYLDVLEHGAQRYSRYAHVRITFNSIAQGTILQMLETHRPLAVFPNVHMLIIYINKGEKLVDNGDTERNVLNFARCLKMMFPNACMIHMLNAMVCSEDEFPVAGYFSLLFSQIMNQGKALNYYAMDHHFPLSSGIQAHITGLVHLTYFECRNQTLFIQLAVNNRNTLESLDLEFSDSWVFLALTLQSNGKDTIEYPRMKKLRLACYQDQPASENFAKLPTPSGLLFPSLEHLTMLAEYPFANDIMFQNNYTKLKYLSLQMTQRDIYLLGKLGVLSKDRFPNLRHMGMDIEATYLDKKDYSRVLMDMAPCLWHLRLEFVNMELGARAIDAFRPDMQLCNTLRYLDLGSTTMPVDQLVELLRYLPNLKQLRVNPTDTVETLDEPTNPMDKENELSSISSEQIQTITHRYYPLCPRLDNLILSVSVYRDQVAWVADYIVSLVLVCPGLVHVRAGVSISCLVEQYHRVVDNLPVEQSHRDRLERLRFI